MRLWLNGGLVPAAEAAIQPGDRGFTLGDGLFETIAVRDGAPSRLDRHLARLRDGAALLGIPVQRDNATLAAAIGDLLAAEGLSEAAVRLTLTRGPGPRGLAPPTEPTPTLLITASPPPPAGEPVRAILATLTRRNAFSPLARIKSLNYLDNILARREATARGADEAILLDTRGRVAEATIANLFIRLDGQLVTPPVADGALPGIMRAAVIAACGAVERSLGPDDVARAEAGFLTSSLGIRPLAELDGERLGDGGGALAEAVYSKVSGAG